MPRFRRHHELIEESRVGAVGDLVAGHKKDVVVSNRLGEIPPKVAIYGFYLRSGHPIQPFALPHEDTYTDYSHGIRLIGGSVRVDGVERPIAEVLADKNLAALLSDEGPIRSARVKL